MVPVGLLVVRPFRVVKVSLLANVYVIAALTSRGILICLGVDRDACVELIINVISLTGDRIGKDLIRLRDFLEVPLSLVLGFLGLIELEIRMVLLGHFVVR